MQDGFIKVAAGTPEIRVADCAYNAQACLSLLHQAAAEGVKVLCLPELCLTGYTCGDLFLQDALLQGAEDALRSLLEGSKDLDLLAVVGVPVRYNQKLFNCAAVFCRGALLGLVPKISTPIVNNGSLTQRKSRPAENSTLSCPAKGMQKSVPRSSRPEVNQRPS